MLSVLKKKAEERRQALAERPEYVTDIEYDELEDIPENIKEQLIVELYSK